MTVDVYEVLGRIVLGAFLGAVGQGIRIVVGIKKQMEVATRTTQQLGDVFDAKKLILSFIIAFTVGGIAGVLSVVASIDEKITRESLMTLIAVGYAGTDFIEGFMKTKV